MMPSFFSPLMSLLLLGLLDSMVASFTISQSSSPRPSTSTRIHLFGVGSGPRIPASPSDRDSSAASSVRSALARPRTPSYPLVECEFPALAALNKLGDGSLRSSLEAEDANVAFAARLAGGIAVPVFGPDVTLVVSSSASNALLGKVRKRVRGAAIVSAKDGVPEASGKGKDGGVFVFLTPTSQRDYQTARALAESGRPTVLVNGSFKASQNEIARYFGCGVLLPNECPHLTVNFT